MGMSHQCLHPLPPTPPLPCTTQQPSCETGPMERMRGVAPQPRMGSPHCLGACRAAQSRMLPPWEDLGLSQWAVLHGIKTMLYCSSLLFAITNYKNKQRHRTSTTEARQLTSFKAISDLKTANSQIFLKIQVMSYTDIQYPSPQVQASAASSHQWRQAMGHISYSTKREHQLLARLLLDQGKVTPW